MGGKKFSMSNLRLINSTSITSSVSSLSLTDVFSSDFDVYKIIVRAECISGSATGTNIRFINSSGNIVSDAKYDSGLYGLRANSSAFEIRTVNGTSFVSIGNVYNEMGGGSVFYIFTPYNSNNYTYIIGEGSAFDSSGRSYRSLGGFTQDVSFTGIDFQFVDANVDEGVFRVFGYRVDT